MGTEAQGNDAKNAGDAGHAAGGRQLVVVQTQRARRPVDDERRGVGRGGRGEGIVGGRRVDVDVAVGEGGAHSAEEVEEAVVESRGTTVLQ